MALSVSTTNYEIPQSENDDITHTCFKYMLDRQFAFSAYCEELGGEKKYFLGPAEVKCNACAILGCLAQLVNLYFIQVLHPHALIIIDNYRSIIRFNSSNVYTIIMY